mgnify:CR=1 FL=1
MIPNWPEPDTSDSIYYDCSSIFTSGERNHHISNTAYPIAHDETWKSYRVKQENIQNTIEKSFSHLNEINLYTHIPFCETRCYFCEYTVVAKKELDQTNEYMLGLKHELQLYRELIGKKKIVGFDIGGGTPSFLESSLIEKHIADVNQYFNISEDCEISIETTPKIASLEPEKIKAYYLTGIRRISMGLQVTEPDLLKILGRSENGINHHKTAMEHMRVAGFQKINLDIMYGFANQSLTSLEHTLRHTIALAPEYITLYRMRYKLTRISDQAHLVDLQKVKDQANLAKLILNDAGYFANPGKNTYVRIKNDTGTSTYLTKRVIHGRSYLGLGLGAQSFTDNTISYNAGSIGKNLSPYLNKTNSKILPIQDLYHLPKIQMTAKMIAVSFYFGEINLFAFKEKFKISL